MNIKKYTTLKRKFQSYITIGIAIAVFGCSTTNIPKAIIPPPPKQTESALPSIRKVDSGVNETISNNNKLGDKLSQSKQVINDQNISIVEALAQAEKIKEKALAKVAISELEATNLINELKKVQTRNLFLEKQNEELEILKHDQEKVLQIIRETLDKTKEQVTNKENETDQLRNQIVYFTKSLTDKNEESEKLKLLLQKEKEVSASAKVYRNIIWTIAGVWFGWTILKNILMLYFPLTKFRV